MVKMNNKFKLLKILMDSGVNFVCTGKQGSVKNITISDRKEEKDK